MKTKEEILEKLIAMTRSLGEAHKDYVILGEGNSSARIDEETFWVKVSAAKMGTIGPEGFVEVRFDRILDMLEGGGLSDEEVKEGLMAAKVDPNAPGRPSVETMLHALALTGGGVAFVGHTHPTAVNAILCSKRAEEAISGRLFPDEVVVCGPAPAYVPYTDPGLPLARQVRQVLEEYAEKYGEAAKVIVIQNHGLIALGRSTDQVEYITDMYVKTCRVLLGTYALGGPNFMSQQAVERIHSRPDIMHRRREFARRAGEEVKE
jgi:rhamnose utilization protein RhaD (predicted bifunctional aldolase and dehydrogenase)